MSAAGESRPFCLHIPSCLAGDRPNCRGDDSPVFRIVERVFRILEHEARTKTTPRPGVMSPTSSRTVSASTDERHVRRHDGHELHVSLERQAGHENKPPARRGSPTSMVRPQSCRRLGVLRLSSWQPFRYSHFRYRFAPQAMPYLRPSSEIDRVSPVTPCFVVA